MYEMAETVLTIVFAALIVESVWETLKMVWQEGKFSLDRVGAIVVGLTVAFSGPYDLFVMLGNPLKFPTVGTILTGILFSRGANFIHDLIKKREIQPQ